MTALHVAVTGASGFIGRHVVAELTKHNVRISAASRSPARISELRIPCNVVELDIADEPSGAYAKLGRPDVLVHLAWGGLPNYGSQDHFTIELPSQYKFLKAMIDQGLSHLLVAGTCQEYGMQSGALSASDRADPQTPYAIAKDALRRELQALQKRKPFGFTWARLFYMYGEGQAPNSLYPSLKSAVSRGERAFNMSIGEQLRDYLPVWQVAHQMVNLAVRRDSLGIINICSGRPVSVRRLVENWLETEKWKIELNLGFYPLPDYEPFAFWGIPFKEEPLG